MTQSYEKALKYCLNLLAKQDYPELEIRKKLENKGNNAEITDKVILYLKEKKYLDDSAYMSRLIEKYTKIEPAGKLYIAAKLEAKGFTESDFSRLLSGLDEEKLAQAAVKLRKKNKPADREKFNNAQYWGKYLVLRGFEYDIIEKITEGMKEEY